MTYCPCAQGAIKPGRKGECCKAEPEEEDTCDTGTGHSWEYLYSVYECTTCQERYSDD